MESVGRQLGIGPTDNTSHERTPRQRLRIIPPAARGSFVPYLNSLPGLRAGENDLTRIATGRPRAEGESIEVLGKLTDEFGRPLRGILLEIWNANKYGRYTHREDHSGLQLDPNFLGLGRVLTDDDGNYRFSTILPGAYLARPDIGRWRPKHIHMSIRGGSTRLITQMYFEGDEYNERDPMRILMGDAFPRNVGSECEPSSAEVSRGFRFDIAVGGRNPTFFES